jgi:hypothetical protein
MERAVETQNLSNIDIVLLSNFKQCRWALSDLQNADFYSKLSIVEVNSIKSPRTILFERAVEKLVQKTDEEYLLSTSFSRYFILEDFMRNKSLQSMLSVENDMVLYQDLSPFRDDLMKKYSKLTVLPSVHRRFLSSSMLWVPNIDALSDLTSFMYKVVLNTTSASVAPSTTPDIASFQHYRNWLKDFGCCKQGGIFPDGTGNGLKSWVFSDMTMLAYYRALKHDEIQLFPVLPKFLCNHKHNFVKRTGLHRERQKLRNNTRKSKDEKVDNSRRILATRHHPYTVDLTVYGIGGKEVGEAFQYGGVPVLFDTGKGGWGDHFVSNVMKFNNDTKAPLYSTRFVSNVPIINATATSFSPPVITRNVVFQAINREFCSLQFRCKCFKKPLHVHQHMDCIRQPGITCACPHGNETWTPLMTLHVHDIDSASFEVRNPVCRV